VKVYSKMVFKGRLLKVFKSRKTLPNGKEASIEEVEHPGAALIVPFVRRKIVFIRQYRPVIGKYIWELPAGTLDKGETPYACAKREIVEETGYGVKNVRKLGYIYTTPGFCNEKIHIFRADCEAKRSTSRECDEIMDVEVLDRRKVRELFAGGKINDSKTIAALSLAGII
jgi:ADP-ribose pyrophosphatase